MPELSRLLIKRWLNGRPAEIWIGQLTVIENMIKEHDLKPLDAAHYPVADIMHHMSPIEAQMAQMETKTAKRVGVPLPKPFPGGLRIPHMHYKDEIYLVDAKQWKDFSAKVISGLKDKLNKARSVSFDQLIEASAGIGSLP
ncbi:MAG: hypothetical protein GY950_29860 [bacterium]|nr:hypothetical protein [bacterium]